MLVLLRNNLAQIITIFVSVLIAYLIELKISNPFDVGQFAVMAVIYSALGLISLKIGMKFSVKKDQNKK